MFLPLNQTKLPRNLRHRCRKKLKEKEKVWEIGEPVSNTTVNNGDWKNKTLGQKVTAVEGWTYFLGGKKWPTDECSTISIISQLCNDAHVYHFKIQQQMIKDPSHE